MMIHTREKIGATTNAVHGCENSVFRFQKPEISALPIRAIRLIRGSQSSHFLKFATESRICTSRTRLMVEPKNRHRIQSGESPTLFGVAGRQIRRHHWKWNNPIRSIQVGLQNHNRRQAIERLLSL